MIPHSPGSLVPERYYDASAGPRSPTTLGTNYSETQVLAQRNAGRGRAMKTEKRILRVTVTELPL